MLIFELFEAQSLKTVVILPGGFHPFHPGHLSLYQSAQKAFPGADIYYAATNDKSERRMYGYSDTVSTGVLTADQIESIKGDIRELKKQKQSINDKVLELNVRTEIELDDGVVEILTKEQLV